MTAARLDRKRALTWRAVGTLILVAAGLYVLQRNWATVHASLQVARGASIGWLMLSLFTMAATFCIAAAIYNVLALHRLRYPQTLLVGVAAALANRLLPAGLGGLGLNGVYLYKRHHTAAEATVVVSVNNLLGIAAHLVLLTLLLVFRPVIVRPVFRHYHTHLPWVWILAVIIILYLITRIPRVRKPLIRFAHNLLRSVRRLKATHVLSALLLSSIITVAYTLILYAAAHSVQLALSPLQVFIVFSFGTLAGTVTPTPGGLVGAEAGLFIGFVAYGAAPTEAGAAVLLFRLVTYWLPLIPGLVALWAARARALV